MFHGERIGEQDIQYRAKLYSILNVPKSYS